MLTAIVLANVSLGVEVLQETGLPRAGSICRLARNAKQHANRPRFVYSSRRTPPSGVVQCLTVGQATALAVQIGIVAYADNAQAVDIM